MGAPQDLAVWKLLLESVVGVILQENRDLLEVLL